MTLPEDYTDLSVITFHYENQTSLCGDATVETMGSSGLGSKLLSSACHQ
jgi:hypothetical protein